MKKQEQMLTADFSSKKVEKRIDYVKNRIFAKIEVLEKNLPEPLKTRFLKSPIQIKEAQNVYDSKIFSLNEKLKYLEIFVLYSQLVSLSGENQNLELKLEQKFLKLSLKKEEISFVEENNIDKLKAFSRRVEKLKGALNENSQNKSDLESLYQFLDNRIKKIAFCDESFNVLPTLTANLAEEIASNNNQIFDLSANMGVNPEALNSEKSLNLGKIKKMEVRIQELIKKLEKKLKKSKNKFQSQPEIRNSLKELNSLKLVLVLIEIMKIYNEISEKFIWKNNFLNILKGSHSENSEITEKMMILIQKCCKTERNNEKISNYVEIQRRTKFLSFEFYEGIGKAPDKEVNLNLEQAIKKIVEDAELEIVSNHQEILDNLKQICANFEEKPLNLSISPRKTRLAESTNPWRVFPGSRRAIRPRMEFNWLENNQRMTEDNKESVKSIEKEYNLLPDCGERVILQLILQAMNIRFSNPIPNNYDFSLTISDLKNKLSKESKEGNWSLPIEMENLLNPYSNQQKITIKSLEIFEKNLIFLRKLLFPLNIHQMEKLLEKTYEAEQRSIQGREIVVFLGQTGSGKSTTILYLAGLKMIKQEFKIDSKQITSIVPENEVAEGIRPSHLMASETKYLCAMDVNLNSDNSDKKITLCDTPGFGDTAGPEVDIANSIGLFSSIAKAKTLKIVVVISENGIGDRGESLTDLINTLLGTIKDIEDRLESFLFLFTHFSKTENLPGILNNYIQSVPQQNTKKIALLKEILRCAEDKRFYINPLDKNPDYVKQKIMNIIAIKKPKEVGFEAKASERSEIIIKETISLLTSRIDVLFGKDNNQDYIPLINLYLDRLKKMKDLLLNRHQIQDEYNNCILKNAKIIQKHYENEIEKFNRCFQMNSELTEKNVKEFQETINNCESLGEIRKSHFEGLGFPYETKDFYLIIQKNLKDLFKKMIENDEESPENDRILKKVRDLMKYFDCPRENEEFEQISNDKIEKQCQLIEDLIMRKDFTKYDNEVRKLYRIGEKFMKKEDVESRISSFEKSFEKELCSMKEKIENTLKLDPFQNKECVKIIEDEISHFEDLNQSSSKNLLEIKNVCMKMLQDYFEKYQKDICNIDDDKIELQLKSFKKLSIFLTIIKEFRKVSSTLKQNTEKTYIEAVNYLEKIIIDMIQSLDNVVKLIIEGKCSESDRKQIGQLVNALQNSEWIDEFRQIYQFECSTVRETIEEKIKETVTNLCIELKPIKVHLNKPEEMEKIRKICDSLENLVHFIGRFFPFISTKFDEIMNKVDNSMNLNIFEKIEGILDNERQINLKKILKYLLVFSEIAKIKQSSWNSEAENVLTRISEKLIEIKINLLKELKKLCFEVRNYNYNEQKEKEFMKIIDNIESKLRKIQKLQKPEFKPFLDDDENDDFQYLTNLLNDLTRKMETIYENQDWKELFNYIELTAKLATLDNFLNSYELENFHKVCHDFKTKYYEQIPDIENIALKAIEEYDYELLENKLIELTQRTDPKSQDVLKEIKKKLMSSLEKLKDSITSSLSNFQVSNGLLKIEKLIEGIYKAEIVNEYIPTENFLKNTINEISALFEELFMGYLNEIEKIHLETNEFSNFDNKIQVLRELIKKFKVNNSQMLIDKMDLLKIEKKRQLDEIVQSSEKVEIEDEKQINQLKKDIDNLKSQENVKYQDYVNIIRGNLEFTLKKRILTIQQKLENEQQDLEEIQTSLKILNIKYQDKFYNESSFLKIFEEADKKIENKKKESMEILDSFLRQEKYSDLNEFLSGKKQAFLHSRVSSDFIKQFTTKNEEFERILKIESGWKCLDELITLEKLIQNFSIVCPNETDKKREILMKEFQTKIEADKNSLIAFFNTQNTEFSETLKISIIFLLEIYESNENIHYLKNISTEIRSLFKEIYQKYSLEQRKFKGIFENGFKDLEESKNCLNHLKKWDKWLDYVNKNNKFSVLFTEEKRQFETLDSYSSVVQTMMISFDQLRATRSRKKIIKENLREFFDDLPNNNRKLNKNFCRQRCIIF